MHIRVILDRREVVGFAERMKRKFEKKHETDGGMLVAYCSSMLCKMHFGLFTSPSKLSTLKDLVNMRHINPVGNHNPADSLWENKKDPATDGLFIRQQKPFDCRSIK